MSNSCFFTQGRENASRFPGQLVGWSEVTYLSSSLPPACLGAASRASLGLLQNNPGATAGSRVFPGTGQPSQPWLAARIWGFQWLFLGDTRSESQNSPGQEQLEQLAFSLLGMTHMAGRELPLTSWLRRADSDSPGGGSAWESSAPCTACRCWLLLPCRACRVSVHPMGA